MEYALLALFAFLRPILFVDIGLNVAGFSLFELAAIVLMLALILAVALRGLGRRPLYISGVDLLMFAFVLWCIGILVAFPHLSDPKDVAQLVLPFAVYTIAKNVIADVGQYRRVIRLMLIGLALPTLASIVLILMGEGIDKTNYWTQEVRFQGVYANAHNAGHNMAFLIMASCIYWAVVRHDRELAADAGRGSRLRTAAMVLLCLAAAFVLYKTAVRTSLLGLMLFLALFAFWFNRRLLWFGVAATALVPVLFPEVMYRLFFDFINVLDGNWDPSRLGSSRAGRWTQQMEVFVAGGPLHMLAGVGIGNVVGRSVLEVGDVAAVNSHNDFMDVLVQTGIVGFTLFMAIQLALLRAIWRMESPLRYAFLALFWAVVAMNFASNSYVARFGLAQMLYVLLAVVEVRRAQQPVGATTLGYAGPAALLPAEKKA